MEVLRPTLVLLCAGIATALHLSPFADRLQLTHTLLEDYDKLVAPGIIDGTVHCKHSIPAASVISLENNVLDLSIWNEMSWTDERLVWEPTEFGNTTQLNIPVHLLWVPDLIVQESIEPMYPGFANQGINVVVDSKGAITYYPPAYLKTKCTFKESDLYTNNKVDCNVKFLSWTYSCGELDVQPSVLSSASFTRLVSSTGWEIETINATHNEVQYDCCPETYCDVSYKFTVRRIA